MKKELTYWTSVLKRIVLFVISVLGIYIAFKLAIFYMPFLIAFLLSLLIEPLIRKIMKKTKLSRRASSIIVFIITFCLIAGLLVWGITTFISESNNLLASFGNYYNKANEQIQKIINYIDISKLKVSENILNIIQESSFSILQKISNYFQNFFTKSVDAITKIPIFGLYFVITILALYFICTDKIYMIDELEHHLPEKWMKEITKHIRELIKILGGYLKAQAILILISFIICLVGLYIFKFVGLNISYPLLFAIGIAFVDALPIIGSGAVMIPWGIICSLDGDLKLGIAIVVLWIVMSIVRQIIEPKIVSSKLGIHPIFTIISMYTGFRLIGVLGMFIGPIVLIILKNIFSNFLDGGIVKTILKIN